MAFSWTRSSVENLPDVTQQATSLLNGNPWLDHGSYVIQTDARSMLDTPSKNYHARIARGEIINNDCRIVKVSENISGGSYHAVRPGTTVDRQGAVLAYALSWLNWKEPIELDYAYYNDIARQAALANINDTPYAFAEDLGEFAETIRFLKNPGKSVLDYTRKLQSKSYKYAKKLKKAEDFASAMNDSYLAYRFAVTPLIKSAADATLAYTEKKVRTRSPRESARGFSQGSDSVTDEPRHYYTGTVYDIYARRRSVSYTVRANVLYTHSGVMDAFHKLGLRGVDLPETAWNLVPLSFMVDRVFDVSNMIRGLTNLADPRLRILAASVSSKLTQETVIDYVDAQNPPYVHSVSGTGTYFKFQYDRIRWQPTVSNTVPRFTPGRLIQDATAVADLFAISANILKGLAT